MHIGRRCRRFVVVATMLACGLAAAPVAAQEATEEEADEQEVPLGPDEPVTAEGIERPVSDVALELCRRMHVTNRFEMKAGRLAMNKGTTDRVRRLGERIMRDHRVADRKVRQLADSLDVSLPSSDFDAMADRPAGELSGPRSQMVEILGRLAETDGAEFDQTYATAMRLSHRTAVDYVSATRLDVEMTSVREVAEDFLPILRQHQELAASVQQALEEAEEPES